MALLPPFFLDAVTAIGVATSCFSMWRAAVAPMIKEVSSIMCPHITALVLNNQRGGESAWPLKQDGHANNC